MPGLFLEEALRIGIRLAEGVLRHGGQATWLADHFTWQEGSWQRRVTTLGADVASGTAGVGSFLAHLAVASGEPSLGVVAVEALRHSLAHASDLAKAGRFGWYDGAFGVAWVATTAGQLLGQSELEESGARLASDAIEAVREHESNSDSMGLIDGQAGIIAGLLAVATSSGGDLALEAARNRAYSLAEAVMQKTSDRGVGEWPSSNPPVGLALGSSGAGLVLAAWSAATGESLGREAANRAFTAERACFEAGFGWRAAGVHSWLSHLGDLRGSWCGGAAGIGIARMGGYTAHGDLILLAEVGAAIEIVRGGLGRVTAFDASLCHGAVGKIELFLEAGSLLAEQAHQTAARNAAHALVESAWAAGGYGSGLGPNMRNPSLLLGLAGIGLTLLRLHEPNVAPSHALPPFLVTQPKRDAHDQNRLARPS